MNFSTEHTSRKDSPLPPYHVGGATIAHSPRAHLRAWTEIDLDAIVGNYRHVRRLVGPNVAVLAAVKADAYGHGAVEVSRALVDAGVDMLGVATVDEAAELRAAGIRAPVLVLSAVLPDDAEALVACDARAVVCDETFARALDQAAKNAGRRVPVHVKVDTGMGRIGIAEREALDFVLKLRSFRHIEIEGIMTHFPTADAADKSFAREQTRRFTALVESLAARGIHFAFRHAANSAAIIDMPEAHLNLVRPGIMLYGCYGSPHMARQRELSEAMTFKARITFLKDVPPGRGLSYGHTFHTKRASRVATIPVGYHDGLPRALSNRGVALVRGVRAPIVGRICMDQTLIDVTDVPGVRVGDEVVLYGQQGDQRISIEEVAARLHTIPHELMCRVGRRVPRVYVRREEAEG